MAVKRKSDPVTFADLGVSATELLQYYRDMLLIRRFEDRA
jgi:TPP-dependent pyruvate/acetoin dehydrogenase alpha subunit